MEYALITGATGGIGYALAECFAKDGKALVLVSSNMEHLKKAEEKLLANYNVPIEVYEKNLAELYIKHILNTAYADLKGLKVVMDCS